MNDQQKAVFLDRDRSLARVHRGRHDVQRVAIGVGVVHQHVHAHRVRDVGRGGIVRADGRIVDVDDHLAFDDGAE